jgi:transcriptional regulator with XRE-family HTH domain
MATADDARRRRELREFLTARRAGVSPASVGLSPGTRRRTPGLRREELAAVAGVGITWYTWLEQGRDIRVSRDTVERIANALRLTQTDSDYLFSLSGVARTDTRNGDGIFKLDESISSVLNAFQGPAFVVGPDWDVEAFNQLADKVYQLGRCSGTFGRNHVWRFFMDPARRALYLDWEALAETAVGLIRAAYARRVGVPYYESLLQALSEGSPEFKSLWSAQRTSAPTPNLVRLSIPRLGEVHVMSVRLPLPGSDDHLLFLLPPVDEKSAKLMARLARRK